MNNADIPVLKVVHLALDEDEELVLAKATCNLMMTLSIQPRSEERDAEINALYTLIQKLQKQTER